MTLPDIEQIPQLQTPSFDAAALTSGGSSNINTGGLSLGQLAGASLNLLHTGSTGLGEEVDAQVGGSAKNQVIMAQGGNLQALINDIQNDKIPKIQQARLEQLKAAQADSDLTPSQAIATAILQIAPVIIGAAVAGKRGGAIGAQSGLQGGTTYLTGIEGDAERKRKRAAVEAEMYGEQEKQAGQQLQQLQLESVKEQFQGEQKGLDRQNKREIGATKVNVNTPDSSTNDKLDHLQLSKSQIDEAIDFIKTNFPNEKSWGQILDRKFTEFTDPNSKEAELASMMSGVVQAVATATNKGVLSDQDIARAKQNVQGGQFGSLSLTLRNLERLSRTASKNYDIILKNRAASGKDITGYEPGAGGEFRTPGGRPMISPAAATVTGYVINGEDKGLLPKQQVLALHGTGKKIMAKMSDGSLRELR